MKNVKITFATLVFLGLSWAVFAKSTNNSVNSIVQPVNGGAGVPVQIYTLAHTTTSGENGSVQALNSSTSASFTLAQAGTTGFALNSAYSFLNIGAGALYLVTTGSAFNGMPVTGSNIVLNQYGYATCAPDANGNWDCAGNQTAAPASVNLGTLVSATNPSINGDLTTGLYTAGAGKVDIAISGLKALELSTTATLNLAQAGGVYQINGATVLSVPTQDNTPAGTVSVGVQNFPVGSSSAAYHNVAIGYLVFGNNSLTSAAIQNVGIGYHSLYNTTSGNNNIAIGNFSGSSMTTGTSDIYVGCGFGNTTGNFNTCIGGGAANAANTSSSSTYLGYQAGSGATGSNDTYIGAGVGSTLSTGLTRAILLGTTTSTRAWNNSSDLVDIGCGDTQTGDTCVGSLAMSGYAGSGGSHNSVFGYQALNAATTGSNNVIYGYQAGKVITGGSNNLILGYQTASTTLVTGNSNIILGTSSAVTTAAAGSSNEINIGGILIYNAVSAAAPAVSACGTSPAIDAHANNKSGTVTVGTVAAASCTVTFAGGGYTTWNHCRVTSQSTIASFAYSYTTTVLTVTGTSLVGDLFDYDCDGY